MTEKEVLILFEAYHFDIYRFAYSFTGSHQDAEDITQSTFLKLLEKQPELQSGKEKAWLMQVAANQCRNFLKSFWQRRVQPLDTNIQETFDNREQMELFDAVMALAAKERAVVYLYYYEGYSQEEIANMLKLSNSAVSMRLHRARKHLKRFFRGENHERAF